MKIVDSKTEIVIWLKIKCDCGRELVRKASQWEVRCKCGERATVRSLQLWSDEK